MFGKSFQIFRLCGIAVRVDLSWFIIVLLITWSFATAVFPTAYTDLPTSTYWWMGLGTALGLFASILLHELAHSLVARRFGVEMKGITLFIFGGVAEMRDEPPNAKAEFWVAIAGPLASVLIAACCLALAVLGDALGWPTALNGVLEWLGFINAIVVAFNLVPAFPLDGGRVLRAALWQLWGNLKRATQVTSGIGNGFGLFLMFLGIFSFMSGNVLGGMWQFVIGMFIRGAAAMSYQQLLVRRALEGETVARFMQTNVVTVPPTITIQELVEDYIYRHHHKMFPVIAGDSLLGCVTTGDVKGVPRAQWNWRTVGETLQACSPENTIDPEADATKALAKMSTDGRSRLMVVREEQLYGVVCLKDMLKFIALKVELEDDRALSGHSSMSRSYSGDVEINDEQELERTAR